MKHRQLKNLFLSQSYLDAIRAYDDLVENDIQSWDYVILTASNEAQAKIYRREIELRIQEKIIPANCKYFVLPDPNGKRVGSGGATLNALKYIAQEEKDLCNLFEKKKVMIIHSGGDSKRVPQYSICGKLFSPVPRELRNGKSSTLFDEFMMVMSSVAKRINEGMLVLSGDVLLLFNSLQLDSQFSGAAAISIKESAEIGKNHGVFLRTEDGYVKKFLHKQPVEHLKHVGAINDSGNVDLDTGAVLLDVKLMQELFSLISDNGIFSEEKFEQFVNDKVRISFYGDFLYPLAQEATLEEYYIQAAEGELCEELRECRTEIWKKLSGYQMKVFSLSPAEFIHFGTTRELLHLVSGDVQSYAYLGWTSCVSSNVEEEMDYAVNSGIILNSRIGRGAYIEKSRIMNANIGHDTVVSSLDIIDGEIPSEIVLHGVQLQNGKFVVRIYGVEDNPKMKIDDNAVWLGTSIKEVMEYYQIAKEQLWACQEESLWNANLYAIADSVELALEYARLLYNIFNHMAVKEEVERWLSTERISLCKSFDNADANALFEHKRKLEEDILCARFISRLERKMNYNKALETIETLVTEERYVDRLMGVAEESPLSLKIRIYYALSMCKVIEKKTREICNKKCFSAISAAVYGNVIEGTRSKFTHRIHTNYTKVELPVRVNWGGGWTDTPPYCMENGGVVLNAAIKLRGINPICAEVRRIDELKIKVSSGDIGVEGYVESLEELVDCSDPYDFFALHKAAIIACGLVPMRGSTKTLAQILDDFGGGFELSTKVIGVPKGSGLGTSSILSAACVKALYQFFGHMVSDEIIYRTVSCIEQLMSTGGGWQDQVGGVAAGIKFITTPPGESQDINVEQLNLSKETLEELNERFALIYTGQRRLARNLLRDVVGNYIGGRKESVNALNEMKRIAVLMRFELEQGNIDAFASLLNKHWELSLQLDEGATNTCINNIFYACDDYILGKFIAGAGGGGFLQVILKQGISKEMLRRRLKEVFQETGVDVWECEIL